MYHQIPLWDLYISPGANSPEEFLLCNVRIVHCTLGPTVYDPKHSLKSANATLLTPVVKGLSTTLQVTIYNAECIDAKFFEIPPKIICIYWVYCFIPTFCEAQRHSECDLYVFHCTNCKTSITTTKTFPRYWQK